MRSPASLQRGRAADLGRPRRTRGAHGEDAEASSRLDELGAAYGRLFADAAAISHDAMEEARAEARKAGAKAARERAAAHPAATSRTVADAGGRELLGALRGRVVRRLRSPRG